MPGFAAVEIFFEPFDHSVETCFGCVGNERDYGVLEVVIDGLEDSRHELAPESFALAVDVAVAATTKVDSFEAAGCIVAFWQNALDANALVFADYEGRAGLKFFDLLHFETECCLNDAALAGNEADLLVGIPKGRANAASVAYNELFS